MRSVIEPETAGFELRPEFEAALHAPPTTCPHCRSQAAARLEFEGGGESATAPSAACPRHLHRTIDRFARYHHGVRSLPPEEQAKLRRIAHDIVRSGQPGCTPVRTVLLVGHADHDPEREQREPGILEKISRARAQAVQEALIHLIGDPDVASRIRWIHRGVADRRPAVPDPQTEDDRARNRRVDVILNPRSQARPQPQPGPGPRPQPSRPGPVIVQPQPSPRPQPQPQPKPAAGSFPPAVIAAAVASRHRWRVPASVTLAQWAIESAFGTRMPYGSNNPFGIKATKGQPYVEAHTREVVKGKDTTIVARFRKFDSIAQAFDEHGRLLATARPYAHAMTLANNPDAFADALTGVYATAPNYGTVLKSVMKKYNLYQYDRP